MGMLRIRLGVFRSPISEYISLWLFLPYQKPFLFLLVELL